MGPRTVQNRSTGRTLLRLVLAATGVGHSKPSAKNGAIACERRDAEAVDRARALGRPVLVSFTADWCVTCQSNKEPSLEIKSVADKLEELDAALFLGDFQRIETPRRECYPRCSPSTLFWMHWTGWRISCRCRSLYREPSSRPALSAASVAS